MRKSVIIICIGIFISFFIFNPTPKENTFLYLVIEFFFAYGLMGFLSDVQTIFSGD